MIINTLNQLQYAYIKIQSHTQSLNNMKRMKTKSCRENERFYIMSAKNGNITLQYSLLIVMANEVSIIYIKYGVLETPINLIYHNPLIQLGKV